MSTSLAMACAAFVVGVSELMTAGISDVIARDLGVDVPAVGSLIFWHAFAYALVPPFLLAFARPGGTRGTLLAATVVFTLAALGVASAPDLRAAILARFVQGAASGVVLAIAIAVAGASVQPQQRGKALATVLMGLSLAMVIGVPIGVLVTEALGWRSAFQGVAVLGLGLGCMLLANPALGRGFPRVVSQPGLPGTFLDRRQAAALVVSFIWMSAYSTMFSYAAPLMKGQFALDGHSLSVAIFSFGLACMVGGYLGGALGDATINRWAAAVGLALNAIVVAVLPFLSGGLPTALWFMAAWGVTSWIPVAPLQSIMASGRGAPDFALGLNNSVIQAGIGTGAFLGGELGGPSSGFAAASLLLISLPICLALPRGHAQTLSRPRP